MKIWKNKFLKQMIIIIVVTFILINALMPIKVYATKSQDSLIGDFFSKFKNSIATAVGFSRGISGDSDWGLENIPGNLLKELGYLFVALGDVGMAAMQVTLLGDANFWIGTMISNKNDNLDDKNSWLYADKDDVEALEEGRTEDARGSMLVIASDEGLKNGIFSGHWKVPNILFSPENIFANKIAALDANYINPHEYTAVRDSEEAKREATSFAKSISPTIASWYRAFRNIAIVGLLSVLVYIGIRIVIGTVSEKAKYKERLQDWLVALCMIFFMHFIMAGIMMLAEKITDLFSNAINSGIIIAVDDGTIFRTSFTGYIRFAAQSDAWTEAMGYSIMYMSIVGITLRYTLIYMKRALYLAFFTMISPLVAVTYPIDKIKDSQAQAFNIWIKEYFINAIIQPVHLVLYSALVGAAMSLVVENPIYGIVALLFMSTAEKWIKKMFKIDQAVLTSNSLGDVALLGTILGMGSKIAGGVVKAGVTIGTAGLGGTMTGLKDSALVSPFRGAKSIYDRFGKPLVGGVEDIVTASAGIPDVNVTTNVESGTDKGNSGISDSEVAAYEKKLREEKEKTLEGDTRAINTKDPSVAMNDGGINPNMVEGSQNLDEMGAVDGVTEGSVEGLVAKETLGKVAEVGGAVADTTVQTASEATSAVAEAQKDGDVGSPSNVKANSPYEEEKHQSEKIDSIKKKSDSDEVKDMINKGLAGTAGLVSGVAMGAFMSGATGENKMMVATPLGTASLGAGLADVRIKSGDAHFNSNVKVLVKESGVNDKNIIKDVAEIAAKENWSEQKMKIVAKAVEDLKTGKRTEEDINKELRENGIESDKLIKKAWEDINKVRKDMKRIDNQKQKNADKIKNWE